MSTAGRQLKAPIVATNAISQITDGVWVIPDSDHTLLVPNIGIIVGSRATLIIDTGLGADNARAVLQQARRLSDGRPVYLTHTHYHPEHGFGANVIAGEVTIVYNDVQWSELQEKGPVLCECSGTGCPRSRQCSTAWNSFALTFATRVL
jgi:glyoxylase-like metal-dependent hydrolase (beta-lactamase superfamily II)